MASTPPKTISSTADAAGNSKSVSFKAEKNGIPKKATKRVESETKVYVGKANIWRELGACCVMRVDAEVFLCFLCVAISLIYGLDDPRY